MSNPQDKKSRNWNKKRKNKNRPKGKRPNNQHKQQGGKPAFLDNQHVKPAGTYSGVIELTEKGLGYLRKLDHEFSATPQDPFVIPEMVRFFNLKPGLLVEGEIEQDQRGNKRLITVDKVNDEPYESWARAVRFDLQTPIMPIEQIKLARHPEETEQRVIDLIAPIGKGQRALIVAPPRTGKTVLLKNIARSIDDYHPDIELAILLVDERPEEVTDFIRTTRGRVFASSNDKSTKSHTRISEMALGYVKRRAEMGKDAVLLIDSITRLSRAYNAAQSGGGRTMSGGLDIRALDIPKKIFGSARKIENGGSLTIVATCLIETNSRMDDLIFEEFKGTGNMELVLDREIANDRIYPAINIAASGTRNEDKFIEDSLEERNMVRRYLLKKSPKESMASLLQVLKRTESNEELLNQIAAYV
ncbi:transcription termination factor Rho [Balneolales bacterium ANBcel1]|nr:transcription termination factor Rho [Balneolales bacterium ANBcel1]